MQSGLTHSWNTYIIAWTKILITIKWNLNWYTSRKISQISKYQISRNEISLVIIIPTLRVYICRAHKKRHKSRGWQTKRLSPYYWETIVRNRATPSYTLFRSNISCYYLYFAMVCTRLRAQSREKEGERRGISVGSRAILSERDSRGLWIFGEDRWRCRTTCLSFLRFPNSSFSFSFSLLMRGSWCNVFAKIR